MFCFLGPLTKLFCSLLFCSAKFRHQRSIERVLDIAPVLRFLLRPHHKPSRRTWNIALCFGRACKHKRLHSLPIGIKTLDPVYLIRYPLCKHSSTNRFHDLCHTLNKGRVRFPTCQSHASYA